MFHMCYPTRRLHYYILTKSQKLYCGSSFYLLLYTYYYPETLVINGHYRVDSINRVFNFTCILYYVKMLLMRV